MIANADDERRDDWRQLVGFVASAAAVGLKVKRSLLLSVSNRSIESRGDV